MNKLEQAAQNLLDYFDIDDCGILFNSRMEALREALASRCQTTTTEQAEQSQLADATLEPVAWANPSGGYLSARYMKGFATGLEKETYTIPLYAAPLAKQDTHATHVVRTKDPCHPWQDLTDDEIADIRMNIVAYALSKE